MLLFNKSFEASYNIFLNLVDFFEEKEGFWKYKEHYLVEFKGNSMVDFNVEEFLPKDKDLENSLKRDCIIVLSPHSSSSGVASLTTHIPGNWGKASLGGKDETLNISYGTKMTKVLKEMDGRVKKKKLSVNVVYEADHHGPTTSFPIMFVELGNPFWSNKELGELIANSIMEVIDEKDVLEGVLGFGGNHYMPKQTKLAKERDYAFTHLLPKYNQEFLPKLFDQALTKSIEKVEKFVIDKKGLNKSYKEFVIKKGEELGIEVEMV